MTGAWRDRLQAAREAMMTRIGIPVYEGVDLLDVAGPYEMFRWIPKAKGIEAIVISEDGGPVTTVNGLTFNAHRSFADAGKIDVLWVPGGDPASLSAIMKDPDGPYLSYIKAVAADATWICSVCEGAMLLAQAGLLDGYKATTHWAFVNCLQAFPEIDVDLTNPRFVECGNRLTGGGISSGLDESLRLIEILTDTETAIDVKITTQYFPMPPVGGALPPPEGCPFSW
jgi:transcriptional regulator GlxA family with amidase domain